MTDSNSQRIGGIIARRATELKQGSNHVLNLFFLRLTISGHCLLDHARAVIMDRQPLFQSRHHCRTPGLTQFQGRSGIMGYKQIFHRCNFRLMQLHYLGKPFKNYQQAAGKILFAFRPNSTAGDKTKSVSLFFNNTITGDAGTGINTDNTYRYCRLPYARSAYDSFSMISSGISKLACTF